VHRETKSLKLRKRIRESRADYNRGVHVQKSEQLSNQQGNFKYG
jgi:hypothetical protein